MIAYHSGVLAYKIVKAGKPNYIAEKLTRKDVGKKLRGNLGRISIKKKKLAISREGFIYRAALLLNKIDEDLRNEEKLDRFKTGFRRWVLQNVAIKPKSKFTKVARRLPPKKKSTLQTRDPQDIRNFLVDRSDEPVVSHVLVAPPTPTDRPPPTCTSAREANGTAQFFRPSSDQNTEHNKNSRR